MQTILKRAHIFASKVSRCPLIRKSNALLRNVLELIYEKHTIHISFLKEQFYNNSEAEIR